MQQVHAWFRSRLQRVAVGGEPTAGESVQNSGLLQVSPELLTPRLCGLRHRNRHTQRRQ